MSSDGFRQRERVLEQEADLGGKLFKENVSAKRALTSASGSSALDSAWIQRSEPKGKPDDDFDPKISKAVGPRKPNLPEDVAKIQRLLNEAGYNVGNSGVYDAATEEAIQDLQDKIVKRDKKSWKPDGIVTPGKATWTELAKEYIVQAPETSKKGERPRTRFPIAVDVMIGPRGSRDKAMQYDAEAAVAAGLEVIQAKGMKGAAEGLEALYDRMLSVDNLYVSSHGNYDTPFIRIGSQKITAGDVNKLAPLRNLLSDDTTLVLTGCHVGGGRAPDAAKESVTSVADTLDVAVYASKSWVRSGTGVFDHGEAGSVVKPGALDLSDRRVNAHKLMGEWIKAYRDPKSTEEKWTTRDVPSLSYDHGDVVEGSEVRPSYSWIDDYMFEKNIETLENEQRRSNRERAHHQRKSSRRKR